MAPIIAPNVVRYSVVGTFQGRPCVNILDMVTHQETGGDENRRTAARSVAGTLIDAWTDHVLGALSVEYTAQYVQWLDMNSDSDSTGTRSSTDDHTWPLAGGAAGQPYGANSALLVTKEIDSQRGTRTGRWYLPAVTEAVCTGNIMNTTPLAEINTGLSDFLEAMTETGITENLTFFPTVVHTKNIGPPTQPEIVYNGNSQIHSLQAQARIASQRRRNRP